MMPRRWLSALAGIAFFLVCFAIAVIVRAPASLIDAVVAHQTKGRVRVAGCEGTLWRGNGVLMTSIGQARTRIEWRIDAGRLLHATLAGTVMLGTSAPVRIQTTTSRVDIGVLDAAFPAALVAAALGPYEAYEIGGDVRVRSQGLVLTQAAGSGRADIEWLQARTGVIDVAPLGSYRMRVDANAAGGRVDLQTLEGPLTLSGTGQWTAGGLALSLTARGSAPHSERIDAWLRTMAPAQPDGSFRFVWPPSQRAGASS